MPETFRVLTPEALRAKLAEFAAGAVPIARYEVTPLGRAALDEDPSEIPFPRELVATAAPRCIYCQCTQSEACRVETAKLWPEDLATITEHHRETREPLGTVVRCWWIHDDPWVCSACRPKHEVAEARGG